MRCLSVCRASALHLPLYSPISHVQLTHRRSTQNDQYQCYFNDSNGGRTCSVGSAACRWNMRVKSTCAAGENVSLQESCGMSGEIQRFSGQSGHDILRPLRSLGGAWVNAALFIALRPAALQPLDSQRIVRFPDTVGSVRSAACPQPSLHHPE